MINRRHAEWMVILFFVALIAVVFQQIYTSMTEQGIASGGPYDNAAAYPKAVAILIGLLISIQAVALLFGPKDRDLGEARGLSELRRPALALAIFALYLFALGIVGYHIATPAMLMALVILGGLRSPVSIIAFSVGLSIAISFFFEVYLKIVLPGGLFGLNIPW